MVKTLCRFSQCPPGYCGGGRVDITRSFEKHHILCKPLPPPGRTWVVYKSSSEVNVVDLLLSWLQHPEYEHRQVAFFAEETEEFRIRKAQEKPEMPEPTWVNPFNNKGKMALMLTLGWETYNTVSLAYLGIRSQHSMAVCVFCIPQITWCFGGWEDWSRLAWIYVI